MNPARKATLLLLSTTVLWGSSFYAMQVGTQGVVRVAGESAGWAAPFLVSFLRFGVAALVFGLIVRRSWSRVFSRGEWGGSFWIALLGFPGITFHGWGLIMGSSTIISFLGNLTVITTPIFAILFFREKLTRGLAAGALLAIVGAWLLTNPAGGGFRWPEWCGLIGAIFFGLQIQLIGVLTKDRDAEAMTLGMFLHFAWLSAAGLLLSPGGIRLASPAILVDLVRQPAIVGSFLYMAVFCSAISMWVFMRWQREIPAWRAAIIYSLEPVFAAIIGWGLAKDDVTTWRLLAGGGLIVLANLAPELLKSRPSAPAAAA